MTDRGVLQADELTRELRHWLRPRAALYGDAVIGTTMTYELAALLAYHAETLEDADAAIEQFAATMKGQVRAFGVGIWHP
jgi:hypothetical protein